VVPEGGPRGGTSHNLPSMTDEREREVWRNKDGRAWRIGGQADVTWIQENTQVALAITSAIPPVFEAYATLEHPEPANQRPARESSRIGTVMSRV
jgi:hypothetical protein